MVLGDEAARNPDRHGPPWPPDPSAARRIAVQSVLAGMGLSVAAMAVAAAGLLAPVAGAVVQEAIDVAVILNALRALGGGAGRTSSSTRRRGADRHAGDVPLGPGGHGGSRPIVEVRQPREGDRPCASRTS